MPRLPVRRISALRPLRRRPVRRTSGTAAIGDADCVCNRPSRSRSRPGPSVEVPGSGGSCPRPGLRHGSRPPHRCGRSRPDSEGASSPVAIRRGPGPGIGHRLGPDHPGPGRPPLGSTVVGAASRGARGSAARRSVVRRPRLATLRCCAGRRCSDDRYDPGRRIGSAWRRPVGHHGHGTSISCHWPLRTSRPQVGMMRMKAHGPVEQGARVATSQDRLRHRPPSRCLLSRHDRSRR